MSGALLPERLTAALARGHRSAALVGIEVERFVLRPDGAAVPYGGPDGVGALLAEAARLTGWEDQRDRGQLIGLRAPDGATLSLEPGAQLEWSSPPCTGLPELARALENWERIQDELGRRCSVRFAALGAHPSATPDDLPLVPKARYAILEPWLRARGDLGVHMMKCTSGVQVNLDHADEAEAMSKLRAALRLAPVFNAMFANSAVAAGRVTGFATWRGHIWTRTEPDRCGIPESLTRAGSRFADYVEFGLAAPMLFVAREGRLVDRRGCSFAEEMQSGAAREEDWDLHLSTLFPEARFRPRLELRTADSVPTPLVLAFAALARALFDRPGALRATEQFGARWGHAQRLTAWHAAHRDGLAAHDPAGGRLLDTARALLALAEPLPEERPFLEPLHALLDEGRSPGERLRERAAGAPERAVALALSAGCADG
jgi:glutamate--cysteine ligase